MPISKEKLTKIIKVAFPHSEINITDMLGTGDHYEIEIKDQLFKDKSKLEQHRFVNKALKEALQDDLHAIVIKTKH
ncbi:MAG: BolA/IbaG family iron-sulfur metabolism protein [Rickettsiales bacterium]|nr:BolA/IbaG family iron-sulfur metabolism protein [Rickettsiales bacterium]